MVRRARLILAVLSASVGAVAQTGAPMCATTGPSALPPIEQAPFALFPRRNFELWTSLHTVLDFYGKPHGAFGPGIELVFTDDLQRFRVGVWGITPLMGHYGDWDHQWISFEAGLSLRVTLARDDLFDFHVLARGSVVATENTNDSRWRGAARVGPGLGLRFGRHLQVEALWMPTVGFADPFVVDGRTQGAYAEGMALQIGWDWCALGDWCAHKPRAPVTEDLSCGLYRKAHDVCVATQDATEQGALCSAIGASLDAQALNASTEFEPADSTTQFLTAVREQIAIPALAARFDELRRLHDELKLAWKTAHDKDRELRGTEPPKRAPVDCRYAVYATELRQLLGCVTPGAQRCTPVECK